MASRLSTVTVTFIGGTRRRTATMRAVQRPEEEPSNRTRTAARPGSQRPQRVPAALHPFRSMPQPVLRD